MSFPWPIWLDKVPASRRAEAGQMFRLRLFAAYVGEPGSDHLHRKYRKDINEGDVLPHIPLPSRFDNYRNDPLIQIARNMFIVEVASLYHSEKGSTRQLAIAMGYTPGAPRVFAGRPMALPVRFCGRIEKAVGAKVLPREVISPDLFSG